MVIIKCCVDGCGSDSSDPGLFWFQLPVDENERRQWIAASRLDSSLSFSFVRFCSLHFKPSDICREPSRLGVLREGAVPSRFPWFHNNLVTAIHFWDKYKTANGRAKTCDKLVGRKINMGPEKSNNLGETSVSQMTEHPEKPVVKVAGLWNRNCSGAPGTAKVTDIKPSLLPNGVATSGNCSIMSTVLQNCGYTVMKKRTNNELTQNATSQHDSERPSKVCKLNGPNSLIKIPSITYGSIEGMIQRVCDEIVRGKAELFHQRSIVDLKNQTNILDFYVRKNENVFGQCMNFVKTGQSKVKYNNGLNLHQNLNRPNGMITPINDAAVVNGAMHSAMPHNIVPKIEPGSCEGVQIVRMVSSKVEQKLPPLGLLKQTPLTVNSRVYVMKADLFGKWMKGSIVEIREENNEAQYKIRFDRYMWTKYRTGKQIAYEKPPDVRLQFGKRVIALYKPEDGSEKPAMYAGIIAEPLKSTNNYRYLIFFDDGVAQYVEHSDVRLVYKESIRVWEDVHPEATDFTKTYIQQFPERPMLKLQKGQVVKTEYHTNWSYARVVAVDGSMVKMHFESEKRFEWIYRGSTRLQLLYNELENAKQHRMTGKLRRHNISRRNVKDQPYVEYTRNIDEIVLGSDSDTDSTATTDTTTSGDVPKRNVARKSTTQVKKPSTSTKKTHTHPHTHTTSSRHREGEIIYQSIEYVPKVKYRKHRCNSLCIKDRDTASHKGRNPLCIPMYMGFERSVVHYRYRGSHVTVCYRTPCGKSLRSLNEVMKYLVNTKSALTIDLFTFDPQLYPFQHFQISKEETLWSTEDITEGKETIPIPCVNCLTDEKPPYVEYATERFPGKGVTLNLDKEFLCGCDCTDNCQDRLKCQCQRLTIQAYSKDGSITDVGYNHRRLKEPIITGLYECNSRCSCKSSCMNRVVQNGLQIRLQMFKTLKKGWGIRCVDDVDAGMFLCIYAGQLLTEQGADEDGNAYGDEYLAELDHIEVAEKNKDGYESDVPIDLEGDEDVDEKSRDCEEMDVDSESSSSSSSTASDSPNDMWQDSDSEFEGTTNNLLASSYSTRSRKDKNKKKPAEAVTDSIKQEKSEDHLAMSEGRLSPETEERLERLQVRKPNFAVRHTNANFTPKHSSAKKSSASRPVQAAPSPEEPKSTKYKSIRSFFNEDYCYIMDAKSKGNIGRYLNHSCSPNSFVQNVFVDTHDLRCPTVAFFANERIRAGTELTWDYNYEVGSVDGKVLLCHCESKNCRGRLL